MSTVEKAGAGVGTYVDKRLGSNRFLSRSLSKVFPDHWSFMLGEIALYCFSIAICRFKMLGGCENVARKGGDGDQGYNDRHHEDDGAVIGTAPSRRTRGGRPIRLRLIKVD
jgi:hypothetical protein